MAAGNCILNLSNIEDFLKLTYVDGVEGENLHYYLGIPDDRAKEIADLAYSTVWDEIEKDEFSTIATILNLIRKVSVLDYNDPELFFYLYWGSSEIDSFLNPTLEIIFDEEKKDPSEN